MCSGAYAQGGKKGQQVPHGLMGGTGKTGNQAGGEVNVLQRRHEERALRLPQAGGGEYLAPPLAPARQGARRHIQGVAYFNGGGAQRGAPLG